MANKKLFGRSLSDFGTLHPGEKKLLEACRTGEVAKLDSKRPEIATQTNIVRAPFIRFLALGGDEQVPVHEHGVQLVGAWITDKLDLEGAQVVTDLMLQQCWFDATPLLRSATIQGSLYLSHSHLPGLSSDRAVIKGSAFLNDIRATGQVRLLGAQIGDSLICTDATFDGRASENGDYSDALSADGVVIKGDVFLTGSFCATGKVRLLGAQIGGDFTCSGAKFDGKAGKEGEYDDALSADRAIIKGGVFLNDVSATGTVYLLGARIGGDLECSGAKFDGRAGKEGVYGNAFSADRTVIEGSVHLKAVSATGEVRLLGAQISGNLECIGANFDGRADKEGVYGNAFSVDRAVINGSVFLKAVSATGKVRLLGAQIGSNLDCSGAKFDGRAGKDGEYGNALSADRAVIKGSVFLKAASAKGEVRLLGAQIGSNLECGGANFDGRAGKDGEYGNALSVDRAVIKGNVFLNNSFCATSTVRLLGAQIGGGLDCDGAILDGKKGGGLSADGMVVAGSFFFRGLKHPVREVSLNHARVGRLIDDLQSWGDRLVLDGFVYSSIAGGAPTSASSRLDWLDKQSEGHCGTNLSIADFRPQPWRQLQIVLREMGHLEDARQVAVAFEDRLRKTGLIGLTPARWWSPRVWFVRPIKIGFHFLFGLLIGYGYRPLLLAGWMLGIWLLCAAFYWCAAIEGVFAPSNPLVFQHPAYVACVPDSKEAKAELAKPANAKPAPVQGAGNWYLCEKLREEYTGFSPLAYSLDVILPLVDLQQEHDWSPLIPTPKPSILDEFFSWDLKRITRFMIWFEVLFGWMSSLLLVAVVSGLTKRREE